MSGAIWSAARNKSLSWRRFWPSWKKKDVPLPARGVLDDSRLVLVGCYREREGLNRAIAEFASASFGREDAVFIHAFDVVPCGWWDRMRAWVHRRRTEPADSAHAPILGTEELLAAGGGFVLFRCPALFQTACEIIERTGGEVGMARRAAA